MIFKGIRLSAKFGKAHGLLLKKKYEKSKDLLMSVLGAGPEEYMLPLIHNDLGKIEYHQGNYISAIKHLDVCSKNSKEKPEFWTSPEQKKLLSNIQWYYTECQKNITNQPSAH